MIIEIVDLFRNPNKKFRICNASNKIKAKAESFSAISVSICNDAESLYESNNILIRHTIGRYLPIEPLFFFGEFLLAFTFDRKNGIGVNLLYTKIAGVGFENGCGFCPNARFLEKSKVRPVTIGNRGANNSLRIPVNNKLRLYRMTLFLT